MKIKLNKLFKRYFDKYRFLKITYFTLIIFILETIFFHVFNYIHDYFDAVLIISYAILGIGLGAFISSKIKIPEKYLFIFCSLGMILSLYMAVAKAVFFASPGISNFILVFLFLFPAIYITRAYAEYKSNQIYLFDMIGCFLGVGLVVLLYRFFSSETIFLLVLVILPLVVLTGVFCQRLKYKKVFIPVFLFFLSLGIVLFYNQVILDRYNLFDLINCQNIEKSPEGTTKIFCRDLNLIKSYDNLIGRIDITQLPLSTSGTYTVSYDGWPNDLFHKRTTSGENDYFKYKNIKWPTLDIRLLYGVKEKPKILVIGSSAKGIIPIVKKITPVENITTVEINPGIIKAMKEDFFEESGKAYLNLDPVYGNGISFLKHTDQKFDIITLMNTHSYRNIAHKGSPDYLHTVEAYRNFFSHLSNEGYLMIEERPETPESKLALYREINTLWHSLKEEGAKDPSSHFIIWSWMYGGREFKKYDLFYFVGIAVFKNPVDEKLASSWVEKQSGRDDFNLQYFKDYKKQPISEEFQELFEMIESNDFSALKGENFDSSIATNNRPFLSQATLSNKKLDKIILNIGILALALWILFTIPLIKPGKRKICAVFNLYNILIGFAFFFIEIILLQVYQNVFLSSSVSFIFVLGFLLLSSGVGGYFSEKLNLKRVTIFLVPLLLITPYFPDWLFTLGVSSLIVKISGVILISITGFLMGFYFPKGLSFVKEVGLKDKVYHFFAINAIAGCFAIPTALYFGIKIGYIYTIIIALAFYLIAGFVLELYKKNYQKNTL